MEATGNRNLAIAGILLGLFLAAVESTVVATAMPTIVASLGGLSIYSWVFSGYLVSSTVTMPLWGRLSDLYGRKKFFFIGVGIFLAGSVLCGLSQTMKQLIVFRFIQGLGAGAVMPLTFTMIGDLFSLEERAKMQGYFSGVWGVASLMGPLVGGYLADHSTWRMVFYINIPFGLLAILFIYIGFASNQQKRTQTGGLDVGGTLLFTGAVLSLLIGLSIRANSPTQSIMLFVASAVLLALYIALENRAQNPLIPLKLFKIKMFRAAQIAGIFAGMAMFGTLSFIPLFMQSTMGRSATNAGQVLLPFMFAWVIFSIIGSRFLLKLGYRKVILTGGVLLVSGFALLTTLDQASSALRVMLAMTLQGAGMGFNMAPFLIAVQSAVPKELMGAATSSTQFVRTVGGAIGVAVMGSTLSHALKERALILAQSADEQILALAQILEHPDSLISPIARQTMALPLLAQAQTEMAAGLRRVFIVGFVFACCSFLAGFAVPKGSAQAQARDNA